MKQSALLEQFISMMRAQIDDVGLYPTPAIALLNNGKQTLFSITRNEEVANPVVFIPKLIGEMKVSEFLIGVDSYVLPEQGYSTKDVIQLIHLKQNYAALGIIEYDFSIGYFGEPIWSNTFFHQKYIERLQALTLMSQSVLVEMEVV